MPVLGEYFGGCFLSLLVFLSLLSFQFCSQECSLAFDNSDKILEID